MGGLTRAEVLFVRGCAVPVLSRRAGRCRFAGCFEVRRTHSANHATVRTLTDEHADAGQILVAAPVLGRPDIAAAGQLGIVAAGPPDALRQAGRLDLTRAVCDSASLRALLGRQDRPSPVQSTAPAYPGLASSLRICDPSVRSIFSAISGSCARPRNAWRGNFITWSSLVAITVADLGVPSRRLSSPK